LVRSFELDRRRVKEIRCGKMTELACKKCKYIGSSGVCKVCGSTDFSKTWYGYVIIIDPEKSEIAKKMGIKYAGRYALIVS